MRSVALQMFQFRLQGKPSSRANVSIRDAAQLHVGGDARLVRAAIHSVRPFKARLSNYRVRNGGILNGEPGEVSHSD